ncbi:hypothetical protein HDU98_004992, partial [Podochytrium sp. JEL0797]
EISFLNGHCCTIATDLSIAKAAVTKPTAAEKKRVARAVPDLCVTDLRLGQGFVGYSQTIFDIGVKKGTRVSMADFIPHCTTISRNLGAVAAAVHEPLQKMNREHLNLRLWFGITCDLWMDGINKLSYASVTSTVIDKNFELIPITVGVCQFFGSHTAEAIKTGVDVVLKDEWIDCQYAD